MQRKSLTNQLCTAKSVARKFAVGISFAKETALRRIKGRSENGK
jgi:hypothetical protein